MNPAMEKDVFHFFSNVRSIQTLQLYMKLIMAVVQRKQGGSVVKTAQDMLAESGLSENHRTILEKAAVRLKVLSLHSKTNLLG